VILYNSIKVFINVCVLVVVLFVLLFANSIWITNCGYASVFIKEVTAVCRDSETQWMVLLCLSVYFPALLLFRLFVRKRRCSLQSKRFRTAAMCLACALLISTIRYVFNPLPCTEVLVFLGCAVLGQGIATWPELILQMSNSELQNAFSGIVLLILVILLAFSSVLTFDSAHSYKYLNIGRWSGPWDNPNSFGILMGVGVILSLGLAVSDCQPVRWKALIIIPCLALAFPMARGLLNSYSRGAWLGTAFGILFLLANLKPEKAKSTDKQESSPLLRSNLFWIKKEYFPHFIILAAIIVIVFLPFRQNDWQLLHRAMSVINIDDFSWRNRVTTWIGSLQMMADHPWFGAGWNYPEPLYEYYYMPPRLDAGTSIGMNDYLILGTTLGVPALLSFGVYLWLSITAPRVEGHLNTLKSSETPTLYKSAPELSQQPTFNVIRIKVICRAGAIALIVGFWFDGGLFKLPTAAIFWILLELGNIT
jgi:hypothetical protein